MKKLNLLIAVAVILMGLTACQKSTKDQLVGTWRYSKTMSVDGGIVSIDGTNTNNEDNTYSDVANVAFTADTEIEGVSVRIKIGMSMKSRGEWSLNDKEIVSSPTSNGVKITYMKLYDPSDGSFLAELTGNDLTEASKEFELDNLTKLLMEASTERIIMQQDDKYITESIDEDSGTKTTITYNRVR